MLGEATLPGGKGEELRKGVIPLLLEGRKLFKGKRWLHVALALLMIEENRKSVPILTGKEAAGKGV